MHSSVYYWVKGQNVHVVNRHWLIFGTVKNLFAVWSTAEAAKMSENFLTLVLAVTTVCMGETTPCIIGVPKLLLYYTTCALLPLQVIN